MYKYVWIFYELTKPKIEFIFTLSFGWNIYC